MTASRSRTGSLIFPSLSVFLRESSTPEIANKTTKASNSMNRATLEVQSSSCGMVKSLSGEAKDKPVGCNNTLSTRVVVACVMDVEEEDGLVVVDG